MEKVKLERTKRTVSRTLKSQTGCGWGSIERKMYKRNGCRWKSSDKFVNQVSQHSWNHVRQLDHAVSKFVAFPTETSYIANYVLHLRPFSYSTYILACLFGLVIQGRRYALSHVLYTFVWLVCFRTKRITFFHVLLFGSVVMSTWSVLQHVLLTLLNLTYVAFVFYFLAPSYWTHLAKKRYV